MQTRASRCKTWRKKHQKRLPLALWLFSRRSLKLVCCRIARILGLPRSGPKPLRVAASWVVTMMKAVSFLTALGQQRHSEWAGRGGGGGRA